MREQYIVAMASKCFHDKQYRKAAEILDRLPDPSSGTNWLRKEIAGKAHNLNSTSEKKGDSLAAR